MYEHMTYDALMNRMLTRVSENYPDIDTREGSMMWNALAPAAIELAVAYTELDNVLNESFAQTATREPLLRKCDEVGIDTTLFDASYAVFFADFNQQVSIGSRWNYDKFNFVITDEIGEYEDGMWKYFATCETEGSEPNSLSGTLTPIDEVPNNLTYAVLEECVILGEDAWSTEAIRTYYFEFVRNQAVDGNVAQYNRWCQEYDGIGGYKVFSLWNGVNTVKVSILSADNKAASETLVSAFQSYLDPANDVINDDKSNSTYPQGRGMGNGVAPIGAIVTVSTATEIPINLSATITLNSGYAQESVEENITASLTNYLASIAYDKSRLPYMGVGSAIIDAEGVDYVSNLVMNGSSADIELTEDEIPVLGTVSWTVVSA